VRKSALFAFGLVAMALVVLGLVVLSSASQAYALRIHGDVYGFLKRQVVYVGAGIAVAAIAALFDYRHFRDHPALVVAMLVATVAALVLVLFSAPVNGSRRWLDLKAFNLQPSELAKLVTVIAVAAWLDRSGWRVGLFRNGLLWPAVIIVMMAVPVLKEPDFGSVMVIGVAGVLMMVLGGVRWMHLMVVFFGGVAVVGAHVLTNANRMARIAAWLGIKISVGAQVAEGAANRAAYQASQALIALKNGGIWGVGINQSMQKKYYLPEAHTDFIFAIGAEELGMVVSIVVVLRFAA
jgi:cell division protein FtsW